MRDSVPSGSYSSVCNVLRQWQSSSSLLIESTDSMIPAAGSVLPFSCARECTQGLLIYVCLYCVNSRWSTWVVRVGEPQKIFKPHSQISKLGMWTICFHILKYYIYFQDYFSRKFYNYVVNCTIFLR